MDWADLSEDQKVRALMNGGLPRADAERQVAILAGASPVDVKGGLPPADPLGVPIDDTDPRLYRQTLD